MPTDPGTGQLIPYTSDEIAAFELKTRGVRNDDHIIEEFSPDGATCTRWWSCAWESRYDVVQYMVGDRPTVWLDGSTWKVSRIKPQQHPNALFTDWRATKIIEIRPYRFLGTIDAEGLPEFDRAEIKVQYEPVPYLVKSDDDTDLEYSRYVSPEGSPGDEVRIESSALGPFPGGIMRYARAGGSPPHNKPIPYGVTLVECDEKFSITWYRLPDNAWYNGGVLKNRVLGDPPSGVKPYIGAVNKTTDVLGRPPGTAMLAGVAPRRRLDPTGFGGYVWDIRFDFLGRAKGFFNLYYYESDGTGANNGYYSVSKNATVVDPTTVADDVSIAWVRDFADLFNLN